MTECRRKTISISPTTLPFGQPTTPRLPKATSHPGPDKLLHLTECPFPPRSSIVGNTFLFGTNTTTPKKKLSDSSILFSPEKRAKREVPLHESSKQNMALSLGNTAKILSMEPQRSPSPSMKRSDVAILDLDQASLGSPLAKRPPRRQASSHFNIHTHSSQNTTSSRRPHSRSISNQPRPLQNLLHQQVQAQHFEFSTPAPPNSRVSRRISVENFLRPPSRDSPFGMPVPMVDASIHLPPQNHQGQEKRPKPHPLSFAESAFSSPSSTTTHTATIFLTTTKLSFSNPRRLTTIILHPSSI